MEQEYEFGEYGEEGEGGDTSQAQHKDVRYQSLSSKLRQSRREERKSVVISNLWSVCCTEMEAELNELDLILTRFGLPSINYSTTKMYEISEYLYPPDPTTCKVKDYLDFYVFPYLLPAIQALIQFARVNKVFQCRFCTFDALDFIVEYLYNNNPRYPERLENPTSIFEIPFCKQWLEKYPRKPAPKWMLMSSDEAAVIIQRAMRGWLVRCKPEVQEMRQFWREIRKDNEEERMMLEYKNLVSSPPAAPIHSPEYGEFHGEHGEFYGEGCWDETFQEVTINQIHQMPMHLDKTPSPVESHHSDNCAYCQAFRKFLESQPEEIIQSYARKPSNLHIRGSNAQNFSELEGEME